MPPTSPREAAGPRRRSLLAGALGTTVAGGGTGLLSGCSGDSADSGPEHDAEARRLRRTAARQSRALLSHYDRTVAAHPDLAGRLKPLRGTVARHIGELSGPAPERTPGRDREGSGADDGGASHDGAGKTGDKPGGPARIPAGRKAALGDLADAERRTSDARVRALAGAPPELARLLASVAAAGAAHAYLLTERDT